MVVVLDYLVLVMAVTVVVVVVVGMVVWVGLFETNQPQASVAQSDWHRNRPCVPPQPPSLIEVE